MNNEENKRYLLLAPSERLKKKKILTANTQIKKIYEKTKNNFQGGLCFSE